MSVHKKSMVAVLATCALATSGCSEQKTDTERSTTLIVGRVVDFVSVDPAVAVGAGDGTVIDLAYHQLTAIDQASTDGSPIGELAEAWSAAPDGMSWTFRLKPGFRFEDGSPVDAEAVKFSFERLGKVNRGPAQSLFWFKAASAVDKLTVRFDLNMPFPALPRMLALASGSIVNPNAVRQHEVNGDNAVAWLSEHTAGSGAYRLEKWERSQRLTLVASPTSVTNPLHFKKVVFRIVPDDSSRQLQLGKGDIDLIEAIGAAKVDRYAELQGVKLDVSPGSNSLFYLTLNTQRSPLNDVRVRRAIAKAIDYAALRDKVLKGHVTLMRGLLPQGVSAYDPSLPEPARDLAGAKQDLASAGFGPEKPLKISMVISQTGPVAETIQSNLADAGITLTFRQLAMSALDAARASGEYEVLYDGWIMDFPDPFIFLNLAFTSTGAGGVANFSRYANPNVDQLLLAAMVESDHAKRTAYYRQAQSLILADLPIVPLYVPKTIMAYRSSLTGARVNPYQPNYLNVLTMGRTN